MAASRPRTWATVRRACWAGRPRWRPRPAASNRRPVDVPWASRFGRRVRTHDLTSTRTSNRSTTPCAACARRSSSSWASQRPEHVAIAPADCERFADDLPKEISPERQGAAARACGRAAAVAPGSVLARRRSRHRRRVAQRPSAGSGCEPHVPPDLAGKRVLDVGSNAGYDPFMFRRLGAEVLAPEPFQFIEQARFLEEIYHSGVDFQPLRWEDLDAGRPRPLRPRPLPWRALPRDPPAWRCSSDCARCADGGTLLLGSMMLAIPRAVGVRALRPGRLLRRCDLVVGPGPAVPALDAGGRWVRGPGGVRRLPRSSR